MSAAKNKTGVAVEWRIRPEFCHAFTLPGDRRWTVYDRYPSNATAEIVASAKNLEALARRKSGLTAGALHVMEYRVKPTK